MDLEKLEKDLLSLGARVDLPKKKEKIIIFNVLELFLAYFNTFNIFTL